jgi:hypothetical protein
VLNPRPFNARAVSLHVYSRPFDTCIVYSAEQGTCGEIKLHYTTEYGNVSAASIGAIQRSLLEIEQQGGTEFFGEPMLDINDLLQTAGAGRGVVNILAADKLMNSPKLYATCLLWMLSELFERLPEIGDPEKPRLVFFFDEAHLLFNEAPKSLLDKIEQGGTADPPKGVGIYFKRKIRSTFPTPCSGSSATRPACIARITPRDQSGQGAAQRCAQTPSSIPRKRSPSCRSAKR